MNEIVVISGKGGTGKTTLTASLAALWKPLVVADCDVDAANLHLLLHPKITREERFKSGVEALIDPARCTHCGRCHEVCVFDAIRPNDQVDPLACEGCGVCAHFCPENAIQLIPREGGVWFVSQSDYGPMVHARLHPGGENSGKLVSRIRQEAKRIAESSGFESILIDGSPGIGCPVISSITGATHAVVVTEATVSGLHDTERILKLAVQFGTRAFVVINKADLNFEVTSHIRQLAKRFDAFVVGMIPYDPAVTEALIRLEPVVMAQTSEATHAIRSISESIVEML